MKLTRNKWLDRLSIWVSHHVILASFLAACTHGPFGIITVLWLLTRGVVIENQDNAIPGPVIDGRARVIS